MAKVKSTRYVEVCKKVLARKTKYGNWFPNNCGLYDGTYLWGDCWCFNPKTIIWGEALGTPVCDNYTKGKFINPSDGARVSGLPDTTGDVIMSMCEGVTSDFSKMIPAELLLVKGHHMGAYLGEWKENGKVYNGCEYNCFPHLGLDGCFPNYTAKDGKRYTHKGGTYLGKWDLHGKLDKWIDYDAKEEPMFSDVKPTDKYYHVYKKMVDEGLMKVDSKKRFKPKKHITRGALALILYRLMKK